MPAAKDRVRHSPQAIDRQCAPKSSIALSQMTTSVCSARATGVARLIRIASDLPPRDAGPLGHRPGLLGLAGLLADVRCGPRRSTRNPLAPKARTSSREAKHIIHLFMNGGPSQVDTFDPKPALTKYNGKKPPTARPQDRAAAPATCSSRRSSSQVRPSPASRSARSSPKSASVHRRPLRHPLDAHEHPQPRAVAVHDDLRRHPADPAEHGLLAALRPGHREPEPAGLRRPVPRQAGRRPAALEQQLPARHLPGQPHSATRPKRDPIDHIRERQQSSAGRARSASSSTCCNELNELHLDQRARRRPARSPHPVAGDGLPHADRGAGSLRPEPRDARRRARLYGNGPLRRRLPARPGGWSSAACAWCRSSTATASPGTITATSRRATATRPKDSDQPIAALLARSEAARPARRDAGAVGRRVRPHADVARAATAATTTTTASRLAGRRRRQGRHGLRRDRRVRLRRGREQGPRPRPARDHPAPAWASTTRS